MSDAPKHTVTPWILKGSLTAGRYIVGSDGRAVCNNIFDRNDAHLLHSAPDLLEELRSLASRYEGVCGNLPFGMMGRSEIAADLAPVLAAIAKAEGQP